MNAKEYPEYVDLVAALRPVLRNLPGKVVAISGRPLSGKTTLGRYLAWRFNVSLLETDLFLIPSQGSFVYREEEIDRIIGSRIGKWSPRPVIIEGATVLRLLASIKRAADFVVRVSAQNAHEIEELAAELDAYEGAFSPKERANFVMHLPH